MKGTRIGRMTEYKGRRRRGRRKIKEQQEEIEKEEEDIGAKENEDKEDIRRGGSA
jgi:hypothetical protein